MRHAGIEALEELVELLATLRKEVGLKEKKPGVFYVKAKAFLHFHKDPQGLFADLWSAGEWQRFRVSNKAERKTLLARVRAAHGND